LKKITVKSALQAAGINLFNLTFMLFRFFLSLEIFLY